MRLGFVSGVIASEREGGIHTFAAFGRLIEALADQVEHLTWSLSVAPEATPLHDHCIRIPPKRGSFVPLPHMPSIARGMLLGGACRKVIDRVADESDVVIVQLPFSAPSALFPATKPRVYHVCADVVEVVRASKFYRGPRGFAARLAALAMDSCQRMAFAGPATRVVTNGAALYQRYGHPAGRAVVSSSLLEKEIGSRVRLRRPDAPFRVLFIGYFRPEKGLDVLVDAFERVLEVQPRAELVVIGARDAVEDGAARELMERIERVGRKGRIDLVGHVPFPEIFQAYADADVLVVPSRSEGTPRVLIEARAFGCPVIASNVGGIPSSIDDGRDGLLVPPDDAAALAAAILRVHDDGAVRHRLVEGGLRRARATTVEAYAHAIIEQASLAAAAHLSSGGSCEH